jgi:hypothetical protein
MEHFVYIRGMMNVDDMFLKWCCEYTERQPWRWIYIENANINFNFSEIRDRCHLLSPPGYEPIQTHSSSLSDLYNISETTKRFDPTMQPKYSEQVAAKDCSKSLREEVHILVSSQQHCETIYKEQWEDELCQICQPGKKFVVLLISPPGAGKTYIMEEDISKKWNGLKGYQYLRFDCSADELVLNTLSSLLSRLIDSSNAGGERKKSLLVADEYHMLNTEQKRELIDWVTPRLSWISVVMIGNRKTGM